MKKYLSTILFVAGILLVLVAFVLAAIATSNKNIIGGAGLSTFRFVFLHENRGLSSTLAFFGVSFIIASIVVKIMNRKSDGK